MAVAARPVNDHARPPSTLSTWPVTQLAASLASHSTASVISCAVPSRRMNVASSSRAWPSAPYDCHWASEAGLERTNPGATELTWWKAVGGQRKAVEGNGTLLGAAELTVIPSGPSSSANCLVSPTSACLAAQ